MLPLTTVTNFTVMVKPNGFWPNGRIPNKTTRCSALFHVNRINRLKLDMSIVWQ